MNNSRLKEKTGYNEKITVYIPSTINIDDVSGNSKSININNESFVNEAAEMLSKLYGGFTILKSEGGWYSDERKQLERENVTLIYAFSDNIESGLDVVIDYCEYLKKALNQDAISIEVNNTLYFI